MNSSSSMLEADYSADVARFGSPSIATASDHSVIARLDAEMRQMLDFVKMGVRASFPGVLHTIGTLSDGDGGGFITLTIQGEYAARAERMFPGVVVYAFTQEGYDAAKIPFAEMAVAQQVEIVIRERMRDILFRMDIATLENGKTRVSVAIQGEKAEELHALCPDVEVRALTEEEYNTARAKMNSSQAA